MSQPTNQHQMPDPNAWLMGSSLPSAKFHMVGDSITGTVLDLTMRQQTSFDSGEPQFWDNGDPKLMTVITLATTQHDPELEDDDGTRGLYVASPKMRDAIGRAARSAGAKEIAKGGRLTVRFIGEGPATGRLNPPKLFAAEYEPPSDTQQASNWLTGTTDLGEDKPMRSTMPPRFQAGQDHKTEQAYTGPTPPYASSTGVPSVTDTPAWRLSQEQTAALVAAGIDIGAVEAKRKALSDVGLDPNMVSP